MRFFTKVGFLLGIMVLVFLIGCGNSSNQIFIPELVPSVAVTEEVFVPTLQENLADVAPEPRIIVTKAPDETETGSNEIPAKIKNDNGLANADVIFVQAKQIENKSWTFSVTVSHPDTGWEDYADGWDVLLPDGTILKPDSNSAFTRLLLHPHENEQPFTRSQNGIDIPADITLVTVRAHDIVDGFGGKEVEVDLTAEIGPDFEIQR